MRDRHRRRDSEIATRARASCRPWTPGSGTTARRRGTCPHATCRRRGSRPAAGLRRAGPKACSYRSRVACRTYARCVAPRCSTCRTKVESRPSQATSFRRGRPFGSRCRSHAQSRGTPHRPPPETGRKRDPDEPARKSVRTMDTRAPFEHDDVPRRRPRPLRRRRSAPKPARWLPAGVHAIHCQP